MIRDGAIGTPLSATLVGRFTVDGARLDWPGQPNPNAWWMDPKRAPGGGWIDHAIYLVDWLEWAFADRIVRVTGVARTLVHHDLHPEKEDFGVALLEFSRGAVATVEVTWSSPRGHYFMGWQIVGTEGDLDWDGLRDLVALAVRFLALFSLAMAVPVLFSAVAATRRDRLREGVLLKTLGATRAQIGRILLAEYALLGLLGASAGMLLSFAGAWGLITFVFDGHFAPAVGSALATAGAMMALAIAILGPLSIALVWRRRR